MLALTDGDRERAETGIFADLLRHELVEGEAVAEGRLARMRRTGEEALPGMVIAVDPGM